MTKPLQRLRTGSRLADTRLGEGTKFETILSTIKCSYTEHRWTPIISMLNLLIELSTFCDRSSHNQVMHDRL